MKIFFGADHAGFELKEILRSFVGYDLGHEVEDMGANVYDPEDDYPDFVAKVAARVAGGDSRGIIVGGSGQGEAMVANRHNGVRAAVYYGGDVEIVKRSREHNDANILSIGARFMTAEEAKDAVRVWLATPFSGDERHARRIKKIDRPSADVARC